MKKAIKISIPEPCHEDWNQMTPTEQGKFCAQCSKDVVDFTKMSDEAIFKTATSGNNLCGRFKASQLQREIKLERKTTNSLLPYAASLLLPASILGTNLNPVAPPAKPMISLGIGALADKSQVIITGFVTDSHGVPIQNAEIIVLETGKWARTLVDGSYTIKCAGGSTLLFQKRGLETQEIKLGNYHQEIDVRLEVPAPKTVVAIAGNLVVRDDQTNDLTNQLENMAPYCGILDEMKEISATKISEVKKDSLINTKGTVVDENNLPIPGVNVIVVGTSKGTQTDFDGHFEIQTEANAQLEFSYIGYENLEITISNISNTIGIQMKPSEEFFLGEVIQIGGLSFDESPSEFNVYEVPKYNEGDPYRYYGSEAAVERRKQAFENNKKFKILQKAKAKAAKLLKRKNK